MIQFVEKFYKLDHMGPVRRILQTGILQTGPSLFEFTDTVSPIAYSCRYLIREVSITICLSS